MPPEGCVFFIHTANAYIGSYEPHEHERLAESSSAFPGIDPIFEYEPCLYLHYYPALLENSIPLASPSP